MRSPEEILRDTKTIALVGASPNPAKPSHGVMRYLLAQGYDVIPVRPLDCDDVLGVPCVATLAEIDRPIDLVDVFRRPEHTPAHAREAVAAGAKALWLQLGIRSDEARRIAMEAGLDYVEDLCTAVVHRTMEDLRARSRMSADLSRRALRRESRSSVVPVSNGYEHSLRPWPRRLRSHRDSEPHSETSSNRGAQI